MAAVLVVAASGSVRAQSAAELDWRTAAELPPQQRSLACPGGYVVHQVPVRDGPADLIHGSSDSAEAQLEQWALMRGAVELQRGSRQLWTDEARWDLRTDRAELNGSVRVREPGLLMTGERAEVLFAEDRAEVEGATFLIRDDSLRGRALRIRRESNGTLQATTSRISRCPPGNNSWTIRSGTVRVDRDAGFVTARHARLHVGPVPILYTPWVRFPINDRRQTGFLFPSIGYSNEKGLDLSVPYYLNLAPSRDITVTPRILSARGALLEAEFRQLGANTSNEVGGAWMPKDNDFNGRVSRNDFRSLGVAGEFDPVNRWLLSWNHRGRWLAQGRLRSRIQVAEISDADYFRDLGTDLSVIDRLDLERVGELRWSGDAFNVRLWAQSFRRLDNRAESYQRLPELIVNWRRDLGPVAAMVRSTVSRFTRDDSDASGLDAITGGRTHLEPRLQWSVNRPYGHLRSQLAYRHTRYDLRNTPTDIDRQQQRNIATVSVDGGLVFERPLNLGAGGWWHTLEPRAYYLYQEYADQSTLPRFGASVHSASYQTLFRENRFAGDDRIGDANHVTLGLQSRLLDRRGRERARLGLAQIRRFHSQRVTLRGPPTAADRANSSSVAADFLARRGRAELGGTVVMARRGQDIETARAAFTWRGRGGTLTNLRYQQWPGGFRRTDLSVYLPVSRQWAVFGRWNFDVSSTDHVEWLAGVQYDSCCWRIRILNRHFVKTPAQSGVVNQEQGIYFQFVLKGVAGAGDDLDGTLRRSIPGFGDDEQLYW